MAFNNPPYVIAADQHSADLFRQTVQSALGGTGICDGMAVTQNSPTGMSVLVAAGSCWIPGTQGSTTGLGGNSNAQTAYGLPSSFTSQGSYFGYNAASEQLTISAADPTNPRIDLVVASVQDAEFSGSANQVILQVVTGVAAASPSPPSAPANSLVLAQIAVAANATSITNSNITLEVGSAVGSFPGSVLKTKLYAAPPSSSYAIGANTWVCLSAANLVIGPVAAPESGQVLVTAYGGDWQTNGTARCLSGVGTASTGAPSFSENIGIIETGTSRPYAAHALITGLTPGNDYSFYLWGYTQSTNSNVYLDGTSALGGGFMVMQVAVA